MKTLPSILVTAALTIAGTTNVTAQNVDAGAAEALAKKSNCLKCHAVDRKKDGPSFKETAGKYKGKPDGEQKVFLHLTTNPTIKVDGKEEKHDSPKTKDEGEIRNLVRWILSR